MQLMLLRVTVIVIVMRSIALLLLLLLLLRSSQIKLLRLLLLPYWTGQSMPLESLLRLPLPLYLRVRPFASWIPSQ